MFRFAILTLYLIACAASDRMILLAPLQADLYALGPIVYILPSFALYLLIFSVFFFSSFKKKYSGSFYHLFCILAVHSLGYSITYYFYSRFLSAPVFLPWAQHLPTRHFLLTLNMVVMYHCAAGWQITNCFISFNRFTVIVLKEGYRTFWNNYLVYFVLVAALLPLAVTWHFWLTDIALDMDNPEMPERGFRLDARAKWMVPWMRDARNAVVIVSLASTIALGMNVFVSVKMGRRWLRTRTQFTSSQNVRLFFFSLIMFFVQMAMAVTQLLFFFAKDRALLDSLYFHQVYIVDLMTLSPAWFLLITSSLLRRDIRTILCDRILKSTRRVVVGNPQIATNSYTNQK